MYVSISQLFSRLREEKPHMMQKLVPVTGDILFDNLGIEDNILKQLYDEVRTVII